MASPRRGRMIGPSSKKGRPRFVALFILLSASGVFAQLQASSGFHRSDEELERYLQDKYVIQRVDIESGEDHHLYGPGRSLRVEGALIPPAMASRAARTPDEVRAFAQAFLTEEAELLQLTPRSEMREISLKTNRWGSTIVAYDRYVGGLRLDGGRLSLTLQAEGRISGVHGTIRPTSPQLLEAVDRPTLSEAEVRLVIKRDLEAQGVDLRSVEVLKVDEKVALAVPPYVVWKAGVGDSYRRGDLSPAQAWVEPCDYTIDAFSGRILEKVSSVRYWRRNNDRGKNRC